MADVRGADNEMLANDTSVRRPSETRMNNSEKSLRLLGEPAASTVIRARLSIGAHAEPLSRGFSHHFPSVILFSDFGGLQPM